MAGLIVAVGLILLIVAHELGHFFAAKGFKLFVHEFGFGFPPRLWGVKRGETEYTLNALPLGGFVRIAGEEDDESETKVPRNRLLSAQAPWKRGLVIVAGVATNALLAWVLLTFVFLVGTPHVVVITGAESGSPAAAAGVKPNDIISGYQSASAFSDAAKASIGRNFVFTVQRGSDNILMNATPRTPSDAHPGALGVSLTEGGIDRVAFWLAPWEALKSTWSLVVATVLGFVTLIANLFSGSVPSDVVGPVGIVSTAGQIGSIGAIYLIQMLAIISINLAVLNLLPIPALDGGKFYLILVEWATGKKIPKWLETRLNAITFLLLIGLMLLLTARDVFRLF